MYSNLLMKIARRYILPIVGISFLFWVLDRVVKFKPPPIKTYNTPWLNEDPYKDIDFIPQTIDTIAKDTVIFPMEEDDIRQEIEDELETFK